MNATRISAIPTNYIESVVARIKARGIESSGGCIEWSVSTDRYGYGQISVLDQDRSRRSTGAHRAAWLALVGPIPVQLEIDHLCRNRRCINVKHMELVTTAENTRRQDHSRKKGRSGARTLATECVRGHAFDAGNTARYVGKDGYERRVCISCRNESNRRRGKSRGAA